MHNISCFNYVDSTNKCIPLSNTSIMLNRKQDFLVPFREHNSMAIPTNTTNMYKPIFNHTRILTFCRIKTIALFVDNGH